MNDPRGEGPDLVRSLLAAAEAVERRIDGAVEAASGLSVPQLDFLTEVDRAGGALPLGKVAEGLACVRSNVTQLADRLESHGWIRREPDPADRRSVRAVLTAEGRRRLEKGADARRREEDAIVEEAGDTGLARALERIGRRAP